MCNNNTLYAYLAGAMDADGYFTIKRNTYGVRVLKNAKNPTYSESVGLRQVTPQVPYLLKDTFGGTVRKTKGGTENSKPLYNYMSTDVIAFNLCEILLPYLRIKPEQVKILIELRESKKAKYKQVSYWFEKEFPDWQEMELATPKEVVKMMGYAQPAVVSRAIADGILLALPYKPAGTKPTPRIPKLLIERLVSLSSNGKYFLPPNLIEWKEYLYQSIKELNKIGINGTSIYNKTGVHKPKPY